MEVALAESPAGGEAESALRERERRRYGALRAFGAHCSSSSSSSSSADAKGQSASYRVAGRKPAEEIEECSSGEE